MLVGGVVDHQLGDHPHAARVRRGDEALDIGERAVVRMHAAVVADVVAVVEPRRRIERQQPDRVDAEIGDVVELGDQAGEIADAVVVGVKERFDVQLIDDRVLVPLPVLGQSGPNGLRAVGQRSCPSHCSRGSDPPDGKWQIGGIEADALALAGPDEALATHQVGRGQRLMIRQAPLPERNFDCCLLRRCADRG